MTDWLSATTESPETWDAVENFFKQNGLTLVSSVSQYGEVLNNGARTGKAMGIEFILYANKKAKISFSPHKLYNILNNIRNYAGLPTNHDTFTPEKLTYVFNWLKETFSIYPDTCHIHQIEIGVNLPELDIDTNTILDNLISYKGKRSQEMPTKGHGRGEIFVFKDYYVIKIYDKALQYGLPGSILRFEIKAKKMQPLVPIFGNRPVLSDLLKYNIWRLCGDKLIETIELCIFNDIFHEGLSAREKAKLSFWQRSHEWGNMRPYQRCKQKRAFDKLIRLHGEYHIRDTIKRGIENEIRKMLVGNEDGNEFTY